MRDLVQGLKGAGLANKTVRNIYGTLHRLFEDAVAYEVLDKSPCRLTRAELPKNVDRDPRWREEAVFSRAELVQLLFDPRLPDVNRMMYGLLGLTGARTGEVVALTWGDYQEAEPLDRLSVHRSFNAKAREFRPTKTEVPRRVPAHPLLGVLLAAWKDRWSAEFGREPTPEDLIIPWVPRSGRMRPWRTDTIWKRLDQDLAQLGLRHRRAHDLRRTFISLCREDGAREDLLKWVTHGRPPGIMDVYTTPRWATLCAQVEALKISPPNDEGPPPSGPRDGALEGSGLTDDGLQSDLQGPEDPEITGGKGWSRRESNPRPKVGPARSTTCVVSRVEFRTSVARRHTTRSPIL